MVKQEQFDAVMAKLVESNKELCKMYFPDLTKREEEYVHFLTEFHLVSGPEIVKFINNSRQTEKRVAEKIKKKLEEKKATDAEAKRVEKARETLDKYMPYKTKRLNEIKNEILKKALKVDMPDEDDEELDDDVWLYLQIRKEIFR